MAKVEPAHQINTNSTKIDDLVTKTIFVDRKIKPDRARILFFGKKR